MSSATMVNRPFAVQARPGALVDALLAAALLVSSLALLAHGGVDVLRTGSGAGLRTGSANVDLLGVVLAAGSTVPLVAWRRSPLVVFVVTAAASVLLAGLDYRLDLMIGPTAALYLLAASRQAHTPWTRGNTLTVVGLFAAYLAAAGAAEGSFPRAELLHNGLALAVAWFAGERTRLRREHIAQLHERALRAEREAERERLLAVAEERARIARDLHDSAGHAISVIAVRAGAARLRHHEDPDRSRVALQAIEDLARQTADEIDQIVASLRDGSPPNGAVDAPPGLASLDTLVARHTAAGLDVTVAASAPPRPLASTADQATYRILQEALTNATRHGTGSARIEVAFDDAAVEVTVTNPVHPRSEPRPHGGGHGLVGMRERATLLGGDLAAERTNGTFRVHACIPYDGPRA